MAIPWIDRGAVIRLRWYGAIGGVLLLGTWVFCIRMPGRSYRGQLPPLTAHEELLRDELRHDVEVLSLAIGERHAFCPEGYTKAEQFLVDELQQAGCAVTEQGYLLDTGETCINVVGEVAGTTRPDEIVVFGAHYDSVSDSGCPAANDNGSGVAATLAVARRLAAKPMARTLRFVLFANEEPPFFWTEQMGSLVYARSCKERGDNVVAMLTPETIGYYRDDPRSQHYPFPFGVCYPSTGNFVGFIGNVSSGPLVRRLLSQFRRRTQFPSEGIAAPSCIPGIGWSDHWSFWKQGYPAVMITDTATFRYPYYHTPDDTPDKLDFGRMARVVEGLVPLVADLGNAQ